MGETEKRGKATDDGEVDSTVDSTEAANASTEPGGDPMPSIIDDVPTTQIADVFPIAESDSMNRSDSPNRDSRRIAAPPTADALPAVFGRYLLRRILGRGGMGVVYLADDPVLKRPVALKIPTWAVMDEADQQRFWAEAHCAARLRHPGICTVFDCGEIESGDMQGLRYLTMAYIDGPTLKESHAELCARPLAERIEFIIKIAKAVGYAHDHGVLHRDLKPQNILLEDGEPIVTDFGLAKQVDSESTHTRPGIPLGTWGYMSLEQAFGESEFIGPHSDVYSLGVMFYQLLTSKRPFEGTTGMEIVRRQMNEQVEAPSSVVPELDAEIDRICLKMLEKKIEERYQSMSAVIEDLRAYLDATRAAAAPRSGWWMALAGVTSLIAVVAMVVAGLSRREPDLSNNEPQEVTASTIGPSVPQRSTRYFVGIGVQEYADGLQLGDANVARRLEQLKRGLEHQADFETTAFLIDEEATYDNVLTAFEELQAVTQPGDLVVVAISAYHARGAATTSEADGWEEVLMLYDSVFGSSIDECDRCLTDNRLVDDFLAPLEGRKVLLAIDTVVNEQPEFLLTGRAPERPYVESVRRLAQSDAAQLAAWVHGSVRGANPVMEDSALSQFAEWVSVATIESFASLRAQLAHDAEEHALVGAWVEAPEDFEFDLSTDTSAETAKGAADE